MVFSFLYFSDAVALLYLIYVQERAKISVLTKNGRTKAPALWEVTEERHINSLLLIA